VITVRDHDAGNVITVRDAETQLDRQAIMILGSQVGSLLLLTCIINQINAQMNRD
jgi:hypothetical protein